MKIDSGIPKGFTLVELMVVIAIIGILAALLLPTLSMAKAYARSTTCKNNLRQMGVALEMYRNDNQGKYPSMFALPDSGAGDPITTSTNRWWPAKLLPYYPMNWTNPVYHCPGYKGAITAAGGTGPLGSYAYNAMGVHPYFDGYIDTNRGINISFTNLGLGLGPPLHASSPSERTTIPEVSVRAPSEMLAIVESRFMNADVNHRAGGECYGVCGCLALPQFNEFAFTPTRHGKNYNEVFCDGHVGSMSPWVLFNPTNIAAMWNSDHQPHPELWVPDY